MKNLSQWLSIPSALLVTSMLILTGSSSLAQDGRRFATKGATIVGGAVSF